MPLRNHKRPWTRLRIAAILALLLTALQPASTALAAAPAPSDHGLPGTPGSVAWKVTDGAPPGQWIFTTEEAVAPNCGIADQATLPDGSIVPNRGYATLYDHELWSNAGLGKPTQVQLTMWQVNYLDPASQIATPWVSTGTTVVQGRARIDQSPSQPTDAKAVVEVQYAEVRHRPGHTQGDDVDVVKWAVRVNTDRTIDYWDAGAGGWNLLGLIPTTRSLTDVPVTARFAVAATASGDFYAGDLEVLVASELHTFPMTGRQPAAEVKSGWAPSITFSLENSSTYDGIDACRQRLNNEAAITRYDLAYSGIVGPANPMDGCSRAHLPCLSSIIAMAPRCAGHYVGVELAKGDQPTPLDDVILGTSVGESINGRAGNDRICGGDGPDTIDGGAGDDHLWGDRGNDILIGNLGNDRAWGASGNDQIFGGPGTDRLFGGMGADIIDGNDGIDAIYGSLGADILAGGAGNDVILGGSGDDQITGNTGRDRLYGEADDDTVDGGPDTDYVDGGDGHDRLFTGPSGNDRMDGGAGNDELRATATSGSTRLVGGIGNDIIIGSNQLDRIWGQDGDDYIAGRGYHDLLRGGAGNDTIFGESGRDTIDGASGNDTLHGGAGNQDRLYGMDGTDLCHGGSGLLDFAHFTCEVVQGVP